MAAATYEPELRSLNYNRLLELLANPEYKVTLRDFLEVVMVIHGVRPAALIIGVNPDSLKELAELLGKERIIVRRYSPTVLAVINTIRVPRANYQASYIRENPKNHDAIGKLLGYMTPFNISKNHGCNKKADIIVEVSYDGRLYKNIQLCPQIICDQTDTAIHEYYAPMVSVISRLHKVFSGIHVESVQVNITPYARPTRNARRRKARTTRKARMTKK